MKPFNLEEALAGDPVCTRNGTPVLELTYFKSVYDTYTLYCSVNNNVRSFTLDGKYNLNEFSPYDLFMAPKKIKIWQRVYKTAVGTYHTVTSLTQTEPELDKSEHVVWKTEWEEKEIEE